MNKIVEIFFTLFVCVNTGLFGLFVYKIFNDGVTMTEKKKRFKKEELVKITLSATEEEKRSAVKRAYLLNDCHALGFIAGEKGREKIVPKECYSDDELFAMYNKGYDKGTNYTLSKKKEYENE